MLDRELRLHRRHGDLSPRLFGRCLHLQRSYGLPPLGNLFLGRMCRASNPVRARTVGLSARVHTTTGFRPGLRSGLPMQRVSRGRRWHPGVRLVAGAERRRTKWVPRRARSHLVRRTVRKLRVHVRRRDDLSPAHDVRPVIRIQRLPERVRPRRIRGRMWRPAATGRLLRRPAAAQRLPARARYAERPRLLLLSVRIALITGRHRRLRHRPRPRRPSRWRH